MEEIDLLEQIKRRLAALQSRIESRVDPKLLAEVASTIQLADVHLPSVFMQARRVLEIIVRDIYLRELPDAKVKPLVNMIEALYEQKRLIGQKIAADLHYIRANGNLIVHPQDEAIEIRPGDAEPVLFVLLRIVEWYVTVYLSERQSEVSERLPEVSPNSYRGLPGDPVANPPTPAEWDKLVRWQQTRIKALDLGIGSDTVLLDLDVEVERTAGLRSSIRALGQRRHRGCRVQQAILTMLADSPGSPLLLEGEPGSGKSIALARLAAEGLAECARDLRAHPERTAPIPLLISLARLPTPSAGEAIAAKHLLDYVVRTGAGIEGAEAGTGAPALYSRCLRWGLRQGRFRILFDGFDEIPALLAAEDAGHSAREYGRAIAAFAGDPDFGQCPTLVASRPYRSPDALNWPKLTLKDLDDKRIREAIDRRFKPAQRAERVFQELVERWEVLGALLRNPLFLDLICRYRTSNERPPDTMAEAFADFVRRRLTDDADRLRGMGVVAADIESGAAEIALRMSADPALGLKPDPGVLLAALREGDWPLAISPERIVYVLMEVHLAAIERQDGRAQFSFKPHRRFHEYFATRAVLANPARLPLDDLLWGDAWRDTTVTLLETAEPVRQRPLRAALRELTGVWAADCGLSAECDGRAITTLEPAELARALGDRGGSNTMRAFRWPERALHLLGILNNASARGAADDPQVAVDVDRVLIAAFLSGKRLHQKTAIELAHAASRAGTLWLLRAAFRSNSAMLSHVALDQAKLLRDLPEPMLPLIRESLVAQWAVGALDRKTSAIARRRLLYLDATGRLAASLRLLNWISRVDLVLLMSSIMCVTVILVGGASLQWIYQGTALFSIQDTPIVLMVILLMSSVFLLPMSVSVFGEWSSAREHRHRCASCSPQDCVWIVGIFPRLIRRMFYLTICAWFAWLAVDLIAGDPSVGTGNRPNSPDSHWGPNTGVFQICLGSILLLPIPAFVYWAFWGFCAPLAALTGRLTKPWQWPFIALVPFLELRSTARQIVAGLGRAVASLAGYTARIGLLAVVIVASVMGVSATGLLDRVEAIDPYRLALGLTGMVYAVFFPAFLSDFKTGFMAWGKRPLDLMALLARLGAIAFSGTRSRLSLVRGARTHRRIAATPLTERRLAQIIEAATRDADDSTAARAGKPAPEPTWDAEIQTWYRKYARHRRGIAFLDGPVLDELILLHADIANALRYPDSSPP